MWSSREVLTISIATGLLFCFVTIYAQNAMANYVNRQILEKTTNANPLVGTGLAALALPCQSNDPPQRRQHQEKEEEEEQEKRPATAPAGSGSRWTPIST